MHVTRLTVSGFRGIRTAQLVDLARVNVIVGPNGAGKTTLLEAAVRLWRDHTPRDLLGRDATTFVQQARNEPVHAMAEPRTALSLTMELSTGRLAIAYGPRAAYVFSGKNADDPPMASTWFRPADGLNAEIERKLWREILAGRLDRVLAAAATAAFGTVVEGIQLPPDGRAVVLLPHAGVPLDSQGDGFRVALRMLMVATVMENATLWIEEPECHQHPRSLAELARALASAAAARNVQLIVTTQSREALLALRDAANIAKLSFAAHHVQRDDEGTVRTTRLDAVAVDHFEDTDLDIRRLDEYART